MPITPSSQRVRVEIDGVTVADSTSSNFLSETGLPMRYYLPQADIQMDLLTPTDKSSTCHWKGNARYWSVTVNGTTHENIAWAYDKPLPEAEGIAGLISFYNEKVDIYIDDELVGIRR